MHFAKAPKHTFRRYCGSSPFSLTGLARSTVHSRSATSAPTVQLRFISMANFVLPPITVEVWEEGAAQKEAVLAAIEAVLFSSWDEILCRPCCLLGTYTSKRSDYPRHLCFQVVGISDQEVTVRVRCAGDKCRRPPATPQLW